MYIGGGWGGSKIEGMGLGEDGQEVLRLRQDTPRGDYAACIQLIVDLVARIESEVGAGTLGIGIPGSLDPRTGIGKGASSTWLNGRPVEQDLRRALSRDIPVENDADCLAASQAI